MGTAMEKGMAVITAMGKKDRDIQHVFLIGSKGIPASYGGFETFVDKLTEYSTGDQIKYHVACASDAGREDYEYHGARCFTIRWRKMGSSRAIFYDCEAFACCIRYIMLQKIRHPIVCLLACRIGPFFGGYVKKIHELGGFVAVNPDGHEWKRAKWNAWVRRYWKFSEQLTVKHADLLICDSRNIEMYIQSEYSAYQPRTTYIAYGAETKSSVLTDYDERFTGWLRERGLQSGLYYLVVGRFVPENNFEIMLREFMASGTDRKLAVVTTGNEKLADELEKKLHFRADSRIVFAGTVYDRELLKKIRECAYGYLHGHEVGGTNPSLLEALGSTRLNLLLDVGFNREVAEDAALYWGKDRGSLAGLIEKVDSLSAGEVNEWGKKAKTRVETKFRWEDITARYEEAFRGMGRKG